MNTTVSDSEFDDPEHLQRAVNATPTLRFAVADPAAVDARQAWWANGRIGHYPGCSCNSCTRRIGES